MIPARRAVAILALALAAPCAALAATPPADAAPGASAPAAAAPPEAADASAPVPRDRFVQDAGYIDAVERQAQQRGVQVHWVNPPERREARTRTLRMRGTLPARESCHGRGCPERAGD
jgi:hypothetical protein